MKFWNLIFSHTIRIRVFLHVDKCRFSLFILMLYYIFGTIISQLIYSVDYGQLIFHN